MKPTNERGDYTFIRVNSAGGKAYQWNPKNGYVDQWISLCGPADDPIRSEGFWRKAGRCVNADIIEFLKHKRLIKSSHPRHNCYKRSKVWITTNITARANHPPVSLPDRAKFKASVDLPDGSMKWEWCETEELAKSWCDSWH